MPFIRVELDPETFNRLAEIAIDQRRPIAWQGEVMLIQAIATWPAVERSPRSTDAGRGVVVDTVGAPDGGDTAA
jgi:hypothetical protein